MANRNGTLCYPVGHGVFAGKEGGTGRGLTGNSGSNRGREPRRPTISPFHVMCSRIDQPIAIFTER